MLTDWLSIGYHEPAKSKPNLTYFVGNINFSVKAIFNN